MNKDLDALDQLIDDAVNEEKSLAIKADELALQSKQFADYLAQKKHNDERLAQLWEIVRDYMEENGIKEHVAGKIYLRLAPLGKYKADEIDEVPDELCKVVRSLDNKKVKAYVELNGCLPDGVQSMGNRLIRKVIE